MDSTDKTRENRIRRMLSRQGYALTKSRRRDPRAYDYGHYVVTREGGDPDADGLPLGRSLDSVEKWALASDAERNAETWGTAGHVSIDTEQLLLGDADALSTPERIKAAAIALPGVAPGVYPVSELRTPDGRIAAIRVDFTPPSGS